MILNHLFTESSRVNARPPENTMLFLRHMHRHTAGGMRPGHAPCMHCVSSWTSDATCWSAWMTGSDVALMRWRCVLDGSQIQDVSGKEVEHTCQLSRNVPRKLHLGTLGNLELAIATSSYLPAVLRYTLLAHVESIYTLVIFKLGLYGTYWNQCAIYRIDH